MAAKPPLLPSANVIELTVTLLPVPTFLLLKVEEFVEVTVSVPIKPDNVNVVVAVSDESYTLFEAEAVAVKALAVTSAVVLA